MSTGPLEEGLRAVAEQLERVVAGLGLTKFGAPGDTFDPTVHEALSHIGEDPEVTVTTCKVVVRAGYRIGDRVVRAAQVLVVDPGPADPGSGRPGQRRDRGDARGGRRTGAGLRRRRMSEPACVRRMSEQREVRG